MPEIAKVKMLTAIINEELDALGHWLDDQQYIVKPAKKRLDTIRWHVEQLYKTATTEYDPKT